MVQSKQDLTELAKLKVIEFSKRQKGGREERRIWILNFSENSNFRNKGNGPNCD